MERRGRAQADMSEWPITMPSGLGIERASPSCPVGRYERSDGVFYWLRWIRTRRDDGIKRGLGRDDASVFRPFTGETVPACGIMLDAQ